MLGCGRHPAAALLYPMKRSQKLEDFIERDGFHWIYVSLEVYHPATQIPAQQVDFLNLASPPLPPQS